jgi:hypothetical protein
MNILIIILVVAAALLLIYFLVIRPWTLTCGATKDESIRPLIGDEIVKRPHFVATRAVTIYTAPSEVLKWIIQIGSGRAGWYGLDWLDNAGVESSRKILPQFQTIEEDYFVPFTPDQKNGMWVKNFQEPEHILYWDKKENSTPVVAA